MAALLDFTPDGQHPSRPIPETAAYQQPLRDWPWRRVWPLNALQLAVIANLTDGATSGREARLPPRCQA